ncbi:alpha/beta hydrolase [Microbacterium telephonicum]|uniref:Acetyl esterase/lipase n=1 Tax=Microbacterium telephonicum TaxID=1714841 RepID=A0A498CKJ9_9MICO|nr:alpha/beta hydrolase [Microbacterium telephonicum]RLK52621.1 acetyl esterase/lipase [Microbacterium telephonicum]
MSMTTARKAPMDISLVDPTLRKTVQRMPNVPITNPVALALAPSLSRLIPGRRVDGVERHRVDADGVRVRVYRPANPSGAALLWIHGGGLVLGAAAMDDGLCGETARDLGVTVVSVDYRFAPRHPFPAAIDDAWTAWRWLQARVGNLGLDRDRIAIGGQSAGGGLAAALVQRAVDAGDRVAAQWLFCPMLDDRTATDRARDAQAHFVWDNRANLVGWRSYLGDSLGAAELPPYAAAARRDDLAGLPPTWIYASEIELFLEEDRAYADRLRAAGVDVTFDLVPGAPHGFEAWAGDTDLARDLFGRARAWLGARLAA